MLTLLVTLPSAQWLILGSGRAVVSACPWLPSQPFSHHHGSSRAGCSSHSISRPCVTNLLLPSAWERAEHPPWRRPKTEALGILLDSMTANAPLQQGWHWEAPSASQCRKSSPWTARFPPPAQLNVLESTFHACQSGGNPIGSR